MAKNNKPFTDFESLIDLQEGNSLFLKTSVDGEAAPVSFPLDLVDLETLCASHIMTQFWTVCERMDSPLSCCKKSSLDFAVMEPA